MKNFKFFSAGQHNKYPFLGAVSIKSISFILTIFAVLAIISVALFGFINQTFADAVNTNDLEADAKIVDNNSSNADTFTSGDFNYSIIDASTCCIESYALAYTKAYIDIPASATDSASSTTYKVTGIKSLQGLQCETVTCSADIDGEFTIQDSAFKNSTVKTFTFSTIHETFGNAVTPVYVIGPSAFEGCTNLNTVNFDKANIKSIGGKAFKNTALTSVSFCPDITCEVGSYVLDGCEHISSITFPASGSITLGDFCFASETEEFSIDITNITIQASLTRIGAGAFGACQTLKEINVTSEAASKSPQIGIQPGSFPYKMRNYNNGYKDINDSSVTVPGTFLYNTQDLESSVTAFYQVFQISGVAQTAFGSPQTPLNNIAIKFYQSGTEKVRGETTTNPNGTYAIGSVFCGLTGAVKAVDNVAGRLHDQVTIEITNNIVADVNGFNFNMTEYLYDEDSGVEYAIGSTAYIRGHKDSLPTTLTLKDSVTSNDDGKAYNVTYIAEGAFEDTINLQEVTLGNGDASNIKTIGKDAFKNSGLTKLKTNKVETIGESAFASNANLADLYIAVWCKEVGTNAFASCEALRTVTFENAGADGVKIGVGAFPFNYWDYVKTNADTYEYKKVIDKDAEEQQTYKQTSANAKFIYDGTGFDGKGADLYRVYTISGSARTNAENLAIPNLNVNFEYKVSAERKITYTDTTKVDGKYSFDNVFCGAYGDIKTVFTATAENDLYDGVNTIKKSEGVHVDSDYSFNLKEIHIGADGVAYVLVNDNSVNQVYAIGTNTNNENVDMNILSTITSKFGGTALPVTKITSSFELPKHGIYKVFSNNTNIKSLDFNDDSNVISINESCFQSSGLESVKIAPSVKTIERWAFGSCSSLATLEFLQYYEEDGSVKGSNLETISENAFASDSVSTGNQIKSVIFPKSAIEVGYIQVMENAFKNANQIEYIEVSSGINSFDKNVFNTPNLDCLVLGPECNFNTGTATFPYYNGKNTNYFEYNTSYSPVINYNASVVSTDDDETVTFIRNKNGFGGNGDGLYKVYNIEGTVSTQTTTSTQLANIDVSYTCKDDSGTDVTSTSTTAGSEHKGEYKIEKAFCGTTGTITAKDSASSTTKHFDSSVDLTEKITKDINNQNLKVIEYIVESGVKYAFEDAASYVCGYTNDLGESVTILSSAYSADESMNYNVTTIADSALKDATTLKDIVISENISSIQDSALKGCTSLDKIEFKATGATLGAEVFDFGFKDYNTDYYDVNSAETINDAGKFKLIKNSTYGRADAFYKLYKLSGRVTDFSDNPLVEVSIKNEDVFETNSGDGGTYSFEGVLCGSTHFDVSKTNYYEDPAYPCTLPGIKADATDGNFRLQEGTLIPYNDFNYVLKDDSGEKYATVIAPTDDPTLEKYKDVSIVNVIRASDVDYPVKEISFNVTLTQLVNLKIPANVTTIIAESFKGCVNLENVIIDEGSNLATIGDSTFEGCSKLGEINFPASLKNIGEAAFKNCASLDFLSIPSTLTSIGDEAFAECGKVDSIMFDGTTSSTTVGNNVWPFHVYKYDSSRNTFVKVNENGLIDTFGKFNIRERNFENAYVKVFDQVFTLSGTVSLDEYLESGVTVTINDKRTGQKYDPSVPDATEDFETGVAAEEPRSITATTDDDGYFEFPEEFAGSINNVVALDLDGVKQVSVSKFGPLVDDSEVEVSLETLPVPPGPEPTPTPDPEFINSTAQTGDALTVFCVFMIAVLTFSIFVFERNRIKNN